PRASVATLPRHQPTRIARVSNPAPHSEDDPAGAEVGSRGTPITCGGGYLSPRPPGRPRCASALRDRPPQPFAHAAAHDPLEVLALQPRQVVREEVDALVVGARHAREVRAPED